MSETLNWQASANEHRTAWIIALLSLLLIFIAAIKPDLFIPSQQPPEMISQSEAPAEHITSRIEPPRYQQKSTEQAAPAIQPKPVVQPVKPAPKAAPKPVAVKPAVKPDGITSGYYLQLGAFKERSRAQGVVDQLQRKGFKALISPKPNGLHAVWVGPEKLRSGIETVQREVSQNMKMKGFIVQQQNR